MKLSHKDALRILDIPPQSTYKEIKIAYRLACKKYHPDRNASGLEMMKLVNAAYQALSDYKYEAGKIKEDVEQSINLGDELNNALNAIHGLGLTIEICGSWIWVSGDTRAHKEALKAAGYKWAPLKQMWHYRPSDYKSYSRGKWSMDQIRDRHGSFTIQEKEHARLH